MSVFTPGILGLAVKVTHRKDIRMVAKAGKAGTKTTPITRSDTPPPEGPANKISLGDFLRINLVRTIDDHSSLYEKDFQEFLLRHPETAGSNKTELRTDFMKTRILYEALSFEGAWGYTFYLTFNKNKQLVFTGPKGLFHELVANIGKSDGLSQPTLFSGSCADISFLFAELATAIGLHAQVKLVRDNHVNAVVRIGTTELRLDLTPVGEADTNRPIWDLPTNRYLPERGLPEKYDRAGLQPPNRAYQQGKQYYLNLDKEFIPVEIVDRLYDRLDPQKRTYPARISLPAHLKPFIDGYMRTRGCYTTYITPYTFRTAEEASRAIRNRTYLLNQQGAKKRYGRCLADHFPNGLEKLGRIIGHQYWAPSLSVETNLQALFSGVSLFNDVAHRIELLQSNYHHKEPKLSPEEKGMLISQLSYLSAHITNLVAAASSSSPDTKLELSPELNQAIAALVHILEKHPSTISFF